MSWLSKTNWVVGDTPVLATVLNNIGLDLRSPGGNVDYGGFAPVNAGYIQLNPGTLPGSPVSGMLAMDATGNLKRYYAGAWGAIAAGTWTADQDAGGKKLISVGSIGVGISNPVQKLVVSADGAIVSNNLQAQAAFVGATDTRKTLFVGFDTTANVGAIQASVVGVSYNALVLNPGGGNVGVGTNNPTSIFHVTGLPTYASDAAAGSAGLTAGAFWKDAAGGLHVKL